MAGLQALMYILCSLYLTWGLHLEVQKVNESSATDNLVYEARHTNLQSEDKGNNILAGGPVSIDCLRCLCLDRSNCLPIGCVMVHGYLGCGYFRFSHSFWIDCGTPGKDWRQCSNNLACASLCVQRYMTLYVDSNNCFKNCEGYSRELGGGPNGCNNPRTVAYWEKVQEVPGCKGVQ